MWIPSNELDEAAELLAPQERGYMLHAIFENPELIPEYARSATGFLHAYGRQILMKWYAQDETGAKVIYNPSAGHSGARTARELHDLIMQPIENYWEPWWFGTYVFICNHRQQLLQRRFEYYDGVFLNRYARPTGKIPILTPAVGTTRRWLLDGNMTSLTEAQRQPNVMPTMRQDWRKIAAGIPEAPGGKPSTFDI